MRDARRAGSTSLFFSGGWTREPQPPLVEPEGFLAAAEDGQLFPLDEVHNLRFDLTRGPIVTYGSLYEGLWWQTRRAGWSVPQFLDNGTKRVLFGTDPS